MKHTIRIPNQLRTDSTEMEKLLWSRLRNRRLGGHKFRRQQPLGRYVVDFICQEKKLVVELDGGQHTDSREADRERDGWLEGEGYKVLRFWDNEVSGNLDGVLAVILDGCERE